MASGDTQIPILSTDLLDEVEALARQQGRPANDLIADAVRVYPSDHAWRPLLESVSRRTRELGLTEEDVPRLIAEYRAETTNSF